MDPQWLLWSPVIERAEAELAEDLSNLDLVFKDCPLELFGELLLDVPQRYPRLKRLLPRMPSEELQRSWAGDAGLPLLYKGTSFVRSSLQYLRYTDIRSKNLKALDFGCGWGRLLRLFSKFFPIGNLEGVDPWDQSIELCRTCGVRNPLAVSDYLPKTIPTVNQIFDFIYSFSVFTHLSPNTFATCLDTLRRFLSSDGLLIITIRPAEYWLQANRPECYSRHVNEGFCYVPHPFKVIDGDSVYGDISVSLEYLARFEQWRIEDVDVSYTDPLQVFVALRPAIK
jgi:Methyltransferase domain